VSRPAATYVYFQPPLGHDPKTQPCRHCGELWSKHEVVDVDRDGELRQCRAVALAGKVGRERYCLVPAVAVLGLVPTSTPFAVLDDLEKVGLALCWDATAAQRIVDALNAAANGGAP